MIYQKNKIESSFKEFDAKGVILAPGCVIPQYVSDNTIKEMIKLIKNL